MAVTHLLIGAGKMGGALLTGWLDSGVVTPRKLAILDPSPGPEAIFAIERGAKHFTQTSEIPKSVQTVLLAIKPQMFKDVGPEIAAALPPNAMIVSILAGTSLRQLDQIFDGRIVIRSMPNTPAAIGAGISAIYADPKISPEKIEEAETLLRPGGEIVRVDSEADLNAVTAISGSGPAYVFHLVEALEAGAVALDLPPDVAAKLARQTIIGSAKLLSKTDESPETLRKNVTSPNGTTQAALDVLMGEDGGLSKMIIATVRAAFARAKQLAK
jgi:pyrroline-5-carboxylate reductase